ncbi:MAG: hypothetical protein ACYCZT_10595 [Thiobacillus sp.]
MPTIRLKGPGLNLWFAEQLVRSEGPEAAREKTCGAAREAVERVIAELGPDPLQCDRCKKWFADDCDIDVRASGAVVCDECITEEELAMDAEARLAL